MNVRYRVDLSQAERDQLSALLSGGTHASRKLKRAQILLAADAGVSDNDIAASIAVGGSRVHRTRRRFVEGDLEAALSAEQRRGGQTHRQRRSPAGGDRLLEPARGPGGLDAGAVGRRDVTHSAGALYETFRAPEAHRVWRRLEFHYTPKHASWLNMVEIEIGVLRGQCLDRRIGERTVLETEIKAWQADRNQAGARIQWKFTTQKARNKLARAYPDTAKSSKPL